MKTGFKFAFVAAIALVAVVVVWLSYVQVSIQMTPEQVCTAEGDFSKDYDGDGYLNGEECKGLVQGIGGAAISWTGWSSPSTAVQGKPALNPAQCDVFIVLKRSPPDANGNPTSRIPAVPFEYISKTQANGGLGLNVYEVSGADAQTVLSADRKVIDRGSSFQRAVKIQESLSASSVLGRCDEEWGTPNGIDNCFVFTQAIKDHVDTTCAGLSDKTKCKDSATSATPLTNPSIHDVYIKHTIAHECGHDMKLRSQYVTATGGYHYASTDNLILSQSVDFRKRKTAVDWFIGTRYSLDDQQKFVLY